MWLALAGSTAMATSLWGRLMESQFIRMFPPPRSVPSVQVALSAVPIPGVSLEKSAAAARSPEIGGPLYWGGGGLAFLASAVGASVAVRVRAVRRATRNMLFFLTMFFTKKFSVRAIGCGGLRLSIIIVPFGLTGIALNGYG